MSGPAMMGHVLILLNWTRFVFRGPFNLKSPLLDSSQECEKVVKTHVQCSSLH